MIALLALLGCPGTDPDTAEETDDTAVSAEVTDPLSMPAVPTLDPADFASATTCAPCHPDHASQWRTSNHAYAIVDPVFQGLVGARQQAADGLQDRFCMQCHTAIGVRGGEVTPGFTFDALSPIAREGVTCEACHKVTDVARPYNAGHVLDAAAPIQGPLPPSSTAPHASVQTDRLGTPEFCASCHDVVEVSGLPLERPYGEWLDSPAASDGRACQDCHMPPFTGRAALGSAERDDLHRHEWAGVDVPFAEGFADEAQRSAIRDRAEALLADAATLEVVAPASAPAGAELDVVVTVTNAVDGHAFPTGSTFLRQAWLEVVATDALGAVVYESGTFDAGGDLRDRWSPLEPYGDPDLVTFGSGFIDRAGAPTLFPWEARDHVSTAIPAGMARTVTYHVPTEGLDGDVHVAVRLRFRPVAPYLLDLLALSDAAGDVPIYDVAEASADVEIR